MPEALMHTLGGYAAQALLGDWTQDCDGKRYLAPYSLAPRQDALAEEQIAIRHKLCGYFSTW